VGATGQLVLPARPPKSRRRLSRRQRIYFSAVLAGSLLAGALVAHALWSNNVTMAGGVITAGDLEAAWVPDSLRWTETNDWSDGGETQSGTTVQSLAAHRFGPGDQLLIEQDFTVERHGNNLVVEFALDAPTWSLASGWQATWTVVDSQGAEVGSDGSPGPVDHVITTGPLAQGEDTYTLQLWVEWLDAAAPQWAPDGHSDTAVDWPLGELRLAVNQVRGAES